MRGNRKRRQRGFIINPFALGAPTSAGLAPNAIGAGANLTLWYDGNDLVQYQGLASTSPLASANNDTLVRADSANAIARVISQMNGLRKIPVAASNNGLFHSNVTGLVTPAPYTKPAAGANPTVNSTIGTLFTNANAVMIMAIKVDDATINTGAPYGNAIILGEINGYLGMYCYKTGTDIVFQAYNFTGGTNTEVTTTVPVGTWTVMTLKHSGGQLRIRRNGGAYTSVASGNTDVTTGLLSMFYKNELSLAQLATYNSAITDANILEVERWMGAKVGITI